RPDDQPRYDDGSVGPGPGPGAPQVPDYGPPPAANDDFLNRATGENRPAAVRPQDPGLRPGQGVGAPQSILPAPRPTATPTRQPPVGNF
ncbi:MAG: penicillin-binding protein, partial [Novosphingobium sp.]